MKISLMIHNLQRFMEKHGDIECWYSVDDEGNAYHKVHYAPSLYYADKDGEVYHLGDIENVEDYKPICIVN